MDYGKQVWRDLVVMCVWIGTYKLGRRTNIGEHLLADLCGSNVGTLPIRLDRTLWPCIKKVMTTPPRMSREAMSRYAMVAYERQQKQAVVESALRRQAERDHEEQCRVAASVEAATSSSNRHRLVRVGKPLTQSSQHGENGTVETTRRETTSSVTQQESTYESQASSEGATVNTPLSAPPAPTPIASPPARPMITSSTLRLPDQRLYVPPHIVLRQQTWTSQQPNHVYAMPLYAITQVQECWSALVALQRRLTISQQTSPPDIENRVQLALYAMSQVQESWNALMALQRRLYLSQQTPPPDIEIRVGSQFATAPGSDIDADNNSMLAMSVPVRQRLLYKVEP